MEEAASGASGPACPPHPVHRGTQALPLRGCPNMRAGALLLPPLSFALSHSALGPSVPCVLSPRVSPSQSREGVGMNPGYLPHTPMSEQGISEER